MKPILLSGIAVVLSLIANSQISGIKAIPGDYTTIQAAIADINTQGVGSGGVIFNVAANHTETLATSTSGMISATGTSTDTIVFRKDPSSSGNNPKITAFTPGASTTVDGMIKIAGGDYITFDGIDLTENTSNTNITKMMEWGYALVKRQNTAPFNGCQYVVIRNCTITLNKINYRSVGIYSGNHIATNTTSLTLTETTDAMNNCRFYSNTISNVYEGIHLSGYNHPYPGPYTLYDHENKIGVDGSNTITNFGGYSTYPYGIFANCQEYLMVGNNVINGGAGSTSFVYGVYLGGSYNASAEVFNNDITLSSASTFQPIRAIYIGFGGVVSGNTESIHDNHIHNCSFSNSATSSSFYGISQVAHTSTANIYNNYIYNNIIDGTGDFYGIEGMGEQVTYLNIYGNQIYGNQKSGGQGNMYCIFAKTTIVSVHDNSIYNNSIPSSSGTGGYPAVIYGYYNYESPTEENYYNNIIHDLSVGGTATANNSGIFGIYSKSAGSSVKNIYSNTIYFFKLSTKGGGTVTGIKTFGGNLVTVYQNEIYNLQADSSNAMSYGIHVQSGNTVNLYNNMISDLKTPQSYYGSAIKGIYLEGGGSLNLFYNTIFLNATSSTTLRFGSAGIVSSASPTVDLRNNLVVNLSTPVHIANSAYTAAFVRTAINLTNYSANSNNNCFYAGTPGQFNVIYWDGTNTDSTMAAYKARVSPRDSQSFTENTSFVNTASIPYDLHILPAIPSLCESGGTFITSPAIINDFDGNARYPNVGYPNNTVSPATDPDVGADEFAGIPVILKTLNLKLYLEGLYAGSGTMNPASDGTGPYLGATIADQIVVSLHQDFPPYSMEISYNGELNTDGTAAIILNPAFSGSYYISIRHRNSIETWSANPVSFAGNSISYDFSVSANQAMGSNLKLMDGKYVLFGGDENQDGLVNPDDVIDADDDAALFVSGYVNTDVNCDGVVDAKDLILIDNNSSEFVSAITPFSLK